MDKHAKAKQRRGIQSQGHCKQVKTKQATVKTKTTKLHPEVTEITSSYSLQALNVSC